MGIAIQRYELAFDGLPPSPNDRLNTFERARLNKRWRTTAKLVAQQAGIPYMNRAHIATYVIRGRLGVADEDNDRLRFKPIVDGLRDAGVFDNDTRGQVVYGPCREVRGVPGVRLIITPQPRSCSRCGLDDETVEPFMTWWFCLNCFADMAKAFLSQQDHDGLVEWLEYGNVASENRTQGE